MIRNKKAFHHYEILEKLEAGIALQGSEVKSIRAGKATISESYCFPDKGELWLLNCHITPYMSGIPFAPDPDRRRKLLLHKKEIMKLMGKAKEKGLSIIPLSMYFSRNRVKVQIGLGKSKKLHDKRATLKEKAAKREIEQRFKFKG